MGSHRRSFRELHALSRKEFDDQAYGWVRPCMIRASQPRAAPTTVPIPPRTVEELHFVDIDLVFLPPTIPYTYPTSKENVCRYSTKSIHVGGHALQSQDTLVFWM